jgi:hypothetical protein
MNRSILIAVVTVALAGTLAPLPGGAQKKELGISVKQDGESVVLTPQDPAKAYLVLAYPRDEKGKLAWAGASAPLLLHRVGEQRISVKEYSKIVVLEVSLLGEVQLQQEKAGVKLVAEPCLLSGMCDKALRPPFPPPPSPFTMTFLLWE